MSEPGHTLIVGLLSPFSDKVQGIFRYKQIPFTRVEVNPKVTAEILVPKTGRHLMPGLLKPDGSGLGDSTRIAHYADDLVPDPPLLPTPPRLEFLTHLLEDYFDEWLTKVMFCLRWTFRADGERAAAGFADTMATDEGPAGSYRDDANAPGEWIDPALLEELYRRIEFTYFPWVLGNRKAVAAGAKTF